MTNANADAEMFDGIYPTATGLKAHVSGRRAAATVVSLCIAIGGMFWWIAGDWASGLIRDARSVQELRIQTAVNGERMKSLEMRMDRVESKIDRLDGRAEKIGDDMQALLRELRRDR